jgi:NAD(P)-dependent dehydrogenase (short-subunit alcohol dehydrogenase family)
MEDLRDKVAVVTGGASGIGRGIAMALADQGCHVVVADVEMAPATAVADELQARGVRASARRTDVTSLADVEALAADAWRTFGHVDLVFNNAGVGATSPLLDADETDMKWLFAVNVFGVWNGCKVFGRRFVEQGTPAHIVNTGSEHSLGVPHLLAGFYTATKHAVLALSDVLRGEVPPHVCVHVFCPGIVQSDFWNAGRNRPAEYGGARQTPGQFKAIQDRGMDPLEIGRRAVEGVRRGDFYVVTHPHARAFADERHREIVEAFEAQAPRGPDDDRWDVNRIVAEVAADLAPKRD